MAVNKEQVKELLGSGLGPEVVATAVGCMPQYITELMSGEAFKEEVTALRVRNLSAASKRDRSIDDIEDTLVSKLREIIDGHGLYKPNDILRAFSVVNNAKRRGAAAPASMHINNTVVNLQLPPAAVKQFTINQQGEVLGVDNQTLVTMPTHELLRKLSGAGDASDKYKQVSKYLPVRTNEIDRNG